MAVVALGHPFREKLLLGELKQLSVGNFCGVGVVTDGPDAIAAWAVGDWIELATVAKGKGVLAFNPSRRCESKTAQCEA